MAVDRRAARGLGTALGGGGGGGQGEPRADMAAALPLTPIRGRELVLRAAVPPLLLLLLLLLLVLLSGAAILLMQRPLLVEQVAVVSPTRDVANAILLPLPSPEFLSPSPHQELLPVYTEKVALCSFMVWLRRFLFATSLEDTPEVL